MDVFSLLYLFQRKNKRYDLHVVCLSVINLIKFEWLNQSL
jgi:hypothetical protein